MAASCSAEEIAIPDSEGIKVEWKVNNRSIVRRDDIVAMYYIETEKSTEKDNSPPSADVRMIRAKKRGSRTTQTPSISSKGIESDDRRPTTQNKPLLGTLIGKILSNTSEQNLMNPDYDNTTAKTTLSSGYTNNVRNAGLQSSDKGSWLPIRAPLGGCIHIYPTTKQSRQGGPSEGDLKHPSNLYLILGKIEPCSHPTIIDGLCVICGESTLIIAQKNASDSLFAESHMAHNPMQHNAIPSTTHDNLTVSGGITVSISSDYAASIATQTLSTLRKARKLQLVLDLDHTLVHATADPRAEYWKQEACRMDVHTILLPMFDVYPATPNNSPLIKHFMKFRNYLAEFLESVMDKYEVIIYTAGTRAYANKTADAISRHLLNYQKKKNDSWTSTSPYCLDEDDLYALRLRVAQIEYEAKLFEDKQSRKKMVELANEQWKRDIAYLTDGKALQRQTDEQAQSSSKDVDVVVNLHVNEDQDDDKNDNKTKTLKRKRVAFNDNETSFDANLSDTADTVTNISNEKSDSKNQSEERNPKGYLEMLQDELRLAETRENEAIALRMKLFGSRIVSRTDVGDLGRDVKSLSRVFPCGGKMAVICDDREDVWANADDFASEKQAGEPPDNLLLTRPFHWQPFLGYADINNASGVDITKQSDSGIAETADDTYDLQLVWTSDILSRLYERYYSKVATDNEDHDFETVPSILRQMRKEVLGGDGRKTNIVLSGVIPVNMHELAEEKGLFTRPPLIRYLETLGANVQTDVTADTTHVVAARDGTDKVKRARQVRGCSIVHVSWLMECYWSISLRDTEPHLINYPGNKSKEKGTRRIVIPSGDSFEDEDDSFNLDAEYE